MIVFVLFLLTGCTAEHTPTATTFVTLQSIATFTATETNQPTSTATRTPRPTFTPTFTSLPTITPIVFSTPISATPEADNQHYRLANWSPEKANALIGLMEAYPDSIPFEQRGYHESHYYSTYRSAALAASEALFRYPTDPATEKWRWQYTHNLAIAGDTGATGFYADLLTQALNSGAVTPINLPKWFGQHEEHFDLKIASLTIPPKYLSSYLIQISDGGSGGFIWLLGSSQGFETSVLISDFDSAHRAGIESVVGDMTNDGFDDVLLVNAHQPGSGGFYYADLAIFDLSHTPPLRLDFGPRENQPFSSESNWIITTENAKIYLDSTESPLLFLDCPFTYTRRYVWNGKWFERKKIKFTFEANQDSTGCIQSLYFVADNDLESGIGFAEYLLPFWKSRTLSSDYEADIYDWLRFLLGVLNAQAGHRDESLQYFSNLVSTPVNPGSESIKFGQRFLDGYKTQQDLYRLCLLGNVCNTDVAFQILIQSLTTQTYPNTLAALSQHGVIIANSGQFDFDQNGQSELWLTTPANTNGYYKLWVLELLPQGPRAINANGFLLQKPTPSLSYLLDATNQTVVKIDNYDPLKLVYLSSEEANFITAYPENSLTKYTRSFDTERDSFLQQLLQITQNPKEPSYLLGLTYELSGDERKAVETYLQVWRKKPDSPEAWMARAKLEASP
jgi:hypothetical protein